MIDLDKIVKNTFYNTIGSFVYLFSQWLMSILVVRLSGSYEEAGVLGIALAVSNILYAISTFSVRYYQVADINDKFSNDEYFTFRIITCSTSLIILPIYLIIMRYSLYISLSIMCYMLIKIAESIVDVVHGVFQKAWRLDIACKSFIIRGVANLAVFSISEWLFKNLIISLFLSAIVSLFFSLLFDVRLCKSMFGFDIDFKNPKLFKLFCCSLPMFLHGFLNILINNTSRIIAQKVCGEELLGFYSSVAAPTIVVQLLVFNVFSPCITKMSEQYQNRDNTIFRTIAAIQGIIIFFLIAAVIGFAVLGETFLKIVFGEEILEYKNLLIPAVLGAVSIATTVFVSSIFTATGHNIIMVILEGITFVVNLILSVVLINKFSLQGINYALILSCVLYVIVGYCVALSIIVSDYRRSA
ncbi:MAG: oligosaccharide flippase family protein [Ruminococcus sp.]|nr:oligosaccharide flippase family protein [Ruminococcus sp.]